MGRLQKMVGLRLFGAQVRGKGAERVHAVAGWDGAPHRSQFGEKRAVKMRQYSSGSNVPQYVPWLNCCRCPAA